jgi:hypothetical protein
MSKLQKSNNRSQLYVLEDGDDSVSTAKSQFAEEYDVDYSNVKGTKFKHPGYGKKYPAYCAVVEVGE